MTHDELRRAAELVLCRNLPQCDGHIWNAHAHCQWCHQAKIDVAANLLARAYLSTPHFTETLYSRSEGPPREAFTTAVFRAAVKVMMRRATAPTAPTPAAAD